MAVGNIQTDAHAKVIDADNSDVTGAILKGHTLGNVPELLGSAYIS